GSDYGTKISVIKANAHKYSIRAMCKLLNVTRSSVYYQAKGKTIDHELEQVIIKNFKESRNNYGTRKIKHVLSKHGYTVSRRKIGKVMKKYGLVSNYTVKHYKVHRSTVNEEAVSNVVNRKFNDRKRLDVAVSDLTYVRVKNRWHYICLIIDLSNREIIGYSSGPNKDASLVLQAFSKIDAPLHAINIFHSDRGNEFKNNTLDRLLKAFNIERSLSNKGTPYDNAVAEAGFKIVKTEFAFNRVFNSQKELSLELFDYVNWYNTIRIHGSLNYQTPVQYRLNSRP
ncbi:MAG: IS3 family transposase, partial [Erysipelothrix sp.]|nr:IS3 family transposase [Erysipelothrix sp.]